MCTFDSVNQHFAGLVSHLRSNDRYSKLAENWHLGTDDDSTSDLVVGICLAGLLNKFEEPNAHTAAKREAEAVLCFLREDLTLPSKRCILDYSHGDRQILLGAQNWIADTFKGIRPDFEDAWFGPGEGYLSAKGLTSPLSKLNKLPITVTYDAFEDAKHMLWSNRQIRRWISSSLRDITVGGSKELNDYAVHDWFVTNLKKVSGSRIGVVPKNNEKDRDICLEPTLNMCLQKMLGSCIRRALDVNRGWDLDRGQDAHANRIADVTSATIDLSSASNLLDLSLVNLLVPTWLYTKICKYRSAFTEYGGDAGTFSGYRLKKVSSMGNGFTFELLTLTLMSMAQQFDPSATVYGDDIVMSRDKAPAFVAFLERCTSYKINHKKSFISGPLRESCGAFYVRNTNVLRFDFKWAENEAEATVLVNKLYALSKFLESHDSDLAGILSTSHDDLSHMIKIAVSKKLSTFTFGPIPPNCGLARSFKTPEDRMMTSVIYRRSSDGLVYQDRLEYSSSASDFNPDVKFIITGDSRSWSMVRSREHKQFRKYCERHHYVNHVVGIFCWYFDPSLGHGAKQDIKACRSSDPRALSVLLKTGRLPNTSKRSAGKWIKRLAVYSTEGVFMQWLKS